MPTFMVTIIQAIWCNLSISISAISQLLLTRFLPNFLDPIFGALIFVAHIFFGQTSLDQYFFGFFRHKFFFGPTYLFDQIFLTFILFDWNKNLLYLKFFVPKIFCTQYFLDSKFLEPKFDFFYLWFFVL